MSECPCKQCICFAICVSRAVITCDLLLGWYRKDYPRHRNSNREMLEKIYGKMNLPTVMSENNAIGVTFRGKDFYVRYKDEK